MVPEIVDDNFWYVDQLLEAMVQLISETEWPKSDQGEFLSQLGEDVWELGSAIRTEAEAGRWACCGGTHEALDRAISISACGGD